MTSISASPVHAHSTVPRHDSRLLDVLGDEHRQLADLYVFAMRAHRDGDARRCKGMLTAFRHLLIAHLRREDQNLYGYLQTVLAEQGLETPNLRDTLSDMLELGAALEQLVEGRYADTATDDTRRRFDADLARIGAMLAQRISEEEAVLYPLYAASGRMGWRVE